jgi:hypothetical protein
LALEAVTNGVIYDIGCYQTLRIFRLGNTHHDKAERYKIPLTPAEVRTMRAEMVMSLAQKPRLNLPTVPGSDFDPALAYLLGLKIKAAQEKDRERQERKAFVPVARPARTPAQGEEREREGSETPVNDTGVLRRVQLLLPDKKWLYNAWNSIPWQGHSNSSSEYDFRVAKELAIAKWSEPDVRAAIQLRPNRTVHSDHYLDQTIRRAFESALDVLLRQPAERIATNSIDKAILATGTLMGSWISVSDLWKGRNLGRSAWFIFNAHYQETIDRGLKADENGWRGPYPMAQSQLWGPSERAVSGARTMYRASCLLQCIGLLRRQDGGVKSTTWMVRAFHPQDLDRLIRAGHAALGALRVKGKTSLKPANVAEAKRRAAIVLGRQS